MEEYNYAFADGISTLYKFKTVCPARKGLIYLPLKA
jgi:hypothetical protein